MACARFVKGSTCADNSLLARIARCEVNIKIFIRRNQTMKKLAKLLALVLAVAMTFSLAACGKKVEETTEPVEETVSDTLVVGYSYFSEKFSPFFSKTAYDQEAASFTQLGTLTMDRAGALVLNGIDGETREYNGTDYTYYGPCDFVVTENEDGTVDYDITMREDLVFSDGEPVTIDDLIFTMYVYCDPSYDGSSTLNSTPIEGVKEYMDGMDYLYKLIIAAGKDNTDFSVWTEEQQTTFWANLEAAGVAFVTEIRDYCVDNGYNADTDPVEAWAANWGFSVPAGSTEADLFWTMCESYGWDLQSLSDTESAGSDLFGLFDGFADYNTIVTFGESASNIAGIIRTGDYSMRVHMTEIDATAILQLSLGIAPMHYYGDADLYDYDNNSFGFTKGDLSGVKSKTTQPLGAGPYVFDKYENGVITYHANENYYLGTPKTKYLLLQEGADADFLAGVTSGQLDIANPSFNQSCVESIKEYNSNGELTGDIVTTQTVDNNGYGYLGICATTVNVGGEIGSEASRNLRKGFQTIFANYRATAVNSYYGERATVIQYPVTNTSWAAPRPSDDGYEIAYSNDIDGNPIYTDSMTEEEKSDAAIEAAIGFFKAAGYTWDDASGKFTAAPTGADLTYEVMIPGDGIGDHPAFGILTSAKEALATIGITLEINDLANSADLWTALESGQCEMWTAAWGNSYDPDMRQNYHSSNIVGLPGSTESNHYGIQDEELDELIMVARQSSDQSFRKSTYKLCYDIVLDWGVELPTYQRQNAFIFSTERVNMDTMTPDITTNYPWFSEIENIEMN